MVTKGLTGIKMEMETFPSFSIEAEYIGVLRSPHTKT
jgi:hypothetical protein